MFVYVYMHNYEPSTMWSSPQHFDGKQATIEQDWLRALRMRMPAPALQATSTPIAHGAGPRRAEVHLGRLACTYAKAGPGWRRAACGVRARSASTPTLHVHSQAAGLTTAASPHTSPRGRCAHAHASG